MSESDLRHAMALLAQLEPALARKDRPRINAIIGDLAAARAPLGEQWQHLAQLAQQGGEIDLARRAMALFVEAAGGSPLARYGQAQLLAQVGAWAEARTLLRSLPPTVPDAATNAYSRGMTALHLGDMTEAQDHFGRVTRLVPQSGSGWLALARTTDLAREPAIAAQILAADRLVPDDPAGERAAYDYALGKLHDDRGEHALAFAAIGRGARALRAGAPYDRQADRRDAEEAVLGHTARGIAAIAERQDRPTGRTIFVTGLPRSGTTLVQQILASHGAVAGGAEIERMFTLARETGRTHPALSRYVAAHGVAEPARVWHHWIGQLFPGPGRVVDKTLDASRFLGLIAAVLPEAPLIWLRRDPLDCAWSCYRTYLYDTRWTRDLGDIAHHFRLEDELLRQWRALLGERLLVVPYEQLVSDPGAWIRTLLAHCGLAEEPGPFAHHAHRGAVATASAVQVRRPINRAGIGVAAPYRAALEPFVAAYAG